MRECFNDHPRVMETQGNDLVALLREAADFIEAQPPSYIKVDNYYGEEGYVLTLYVHDN